MKGILLLLYSNTIEIAVAQFPFDFFRGISMKLNSIPILFVWNNDTRYVQCSENNVYEQKWISPYEGNDTMQHNKNNCFRQFIEEEKIANARIHSPNENQVV